MTTLTIRIDEKLGQELDRLARQTGRPKSEVAREALRRQLAIEKFRKLRQRLVPYAEAAGWLTDEAPATVTATPDMTIYELHVRDFSIADATVPAAHRGKYLAFTDAQSAGMRHPMRTLAPPAR